MEQESEEDAHGAHSSLEAQGQHRANTTVHVCWYRNTSVSRADHSAAVKVQHPLCSCWLLGRGSQVAGLSCSLLSPLVRKSLWKSPLDRAAQALPALWVCAGKNQEGGDPRALRWACHGWLSPPLCLHHLERHFGLQPLTAEVTSHSVWF